MKNEKIQPEDVVKLKELFGIPVRTYIPVIYGLALLLLCFLLFLLPGIVNNGAYVRSSTEYTDTALYVDGIYKGEAREYHFVEKGVHEIRIEKPGFESSTQEVFVPGNLFFSLFQKKRVQLDINPSLNDLSGYLQYRMQDIIRYSPILAYSQTYLYKPLFTPVARDLVTSAQEDQQIMLSFFYTSIGFISSERMFEEYREALDILPQPTAERIEKTEAFRALEAKMSGSSFSSSLAPEADLLQTQQVIASSDGSYYLNVLPTKGLVAGNEYPYEVSIDSFFLATHEVTELEYSRFVEQVPYWSKENLEQLLEDEVVDSLYLEGIDLSAARNVPVSGVSFYAARAYCDWYSKGLDGYVAKLPSSIQWEVAFRRFASSTDFVGSIPLYTDMPRYLSGMFGSLWEMTDTPFMPLGELIMQKEYPLVDIPVTDYSLLTLRGSSLLDKGNDFTATGATLPASCSPVIGFRIILEER